MRRGRFLTQVGLLALVLAFLVSDASARVPPGQLKKHRTTVPAFTTTTEATVTVPTAPPWTNPPAGVPDDFIDVTAAPYSADKTGVADATSAIESAIAAATAGQTVWLPAGTYKVSQVDISSPALGITVQGAGITETILNSSATGSASGALKLTGTTNLTVSDMRLVGTMTDTDNAGVVMVGTNASTTFLRVAAWNWGFCGFWSPTGQTSTNTVFDQVDVHEAHDFGVHMKEGSVNVTVKDSTFAHFDSRTNPAHGIYFDDVDGGLITGNVITDVTNDGNTANREVSGIKVTLESWWLPDLVTVTDNEVHDSLGGVSLPYARNVHVTSNRIYDCVTMGLGDRDPGRGFYVLAGTDDVLLDSNLVDGAVNAFLFYGTNTNVVVSNNDALNITGDYVSPASPDGTVTITGNSWQ